jgi:hypothetical protein
LDDKAVTDALADAAAARHLLPTVIRSDDAEPTTVADRVLAWATQKRH